MLEPDEGSVANQQKLVEMVGASGTDIFTS